jgi:hypothetical protein
MEIPVVAKRNQTAELIPGIAALSISSDRKAVEVVCCQEYSRSPAGKKLALAAERGHNAAEKG